MVWLHMVELKDVPVEVLQGVHTKWRRLLITGWIREVAMADCDMCRFMRGRCVSWQCVPCPLSRESDGDWCQRLTGNSRDHVVEWEQNVREFLSMLETEIAGR